jgi:hypothetical protein
VVLRRRSPVPVLWVVTVRQVFFLLCHAQAVVVVVRSIILAVNLAVPVVVVETK